jgi:hypothetical protein
MSVIFYNNWHNGDIFVSREFVRHIVNKKINDKCFYYHMNSNKLLKDIYTLEIINELFGEKKDTILYKKDKDNIYINTWYRAGNDDSFKKYGITIFTLFNNFKEIIQKNFDEVIDDPSDFIPDPDYNNLIDVNAINDFVFNLTNKKRVLISNNNVLSGQSSNFDFDEIIFKLANKFQDIDFFITNETKKYISLKNVFYFKNCISVLDECNLNEIGYFSLFCDVIIGRLSGPETFCYNFDNLTDKSKTFINFFVNDKMYGDGSFGISSIYSDVARAKFVYSCDFNIDSVIKIIDKELFKCY